MFRSHYGLSFNPFDKQNAKEKDRFLSKDISEMTSRLDYLKDTRGIGLFTARPGMGKSFALRCFAKSLNPYNFSGLSDLEVAQYVLHKIACAGGAASIIEQAALSAVCSHTQESPAWWTASGRHCAVNRIRIGKIIR